MHFSFPAEGSFIHLFAKIAYSFSKMLIWIPCREWRWDFANFSVLCFSSYFSSCGYKIHVRIPSLQLLKCIWRRKKAIFKNVQVFPMWKYFYPWGMKDWWNIQSIAGGSLYKQLWSTERTSLKKIKKKDAIVMNMREIMVERKKIFYPISFNTSHQYMAWACVCFLLEKNKFYRLKTFKLFQNIYVPWNHVTISEP